MKCTTKKWQYTNTVVIVTKGNCIGYDLAKDEELTVCSGPPQRLYVTPGRNLKMVAFGKFGEPLNLYSYYESARYTVKDKNGYIGYLPNQRIYACAGKVANEEKTIEHESFNIPELQMGNYYDLAILNFFVAQNSGEYDHCFTGYGCLFGNFRDENCLDINSF